ncbi:MAG: universal stress protein [Chromatiaceae bacterium]|nr:universal stress protein [Chromatiaceae bacterium]
MFVFAYDGSINGDWVSHYAVQLAAAHDDRVLDLVHVRDGRARGVELREKLERLERECKRQGVELLVHLLPPTRRVSDAIRSVAPANPNSFLICGTRAREGRGGFLSGTTSEQLLRSGHCNVLALRVVQPGLLGSPRRLLLPVAERFGDFRSALPFLQLFGPQVSHLHILSVARVRRGRFRRMSHEATERSRSPGEACCERVEQEIREQLGLGAKVMDAQVVVSDDVPKEILIAANKTKSRLIYMGASERNLTERLVYGNPIERVLRDTTCDVAVYRGVD